MESGSPVPGSIPVHEDAIPTNRQGASRRVKKPERSCAMCHRRKVKCDKKSPCSTCTRTGVLCCYPSDSNKPQSRQPKTTISDIASRLAQLERTLIAVSSGGQALAPSFSQGQMSDEPQGGRQAGRDGAREGTPIADGMLVQNGGSSRYINEVLLSRLLEEEEEIQSVMTTPHPQSRSSEDEDERSSSEVPATFGLVGLFSGHSPASPETQDRMASLRPSTRQATQLWDIFVQNVDPLCKILHIPSDQLTIFSAIANPDIADPDTHCLLFAIYLAAITVLTPEDAGAILGQEKTLLIRNFKLGFELSLAQSTFLDHPTIRGLQALGIYLYCLRAHTSGRSIWILNGMLMRAAHSIGLHRDGTNFPRMSAFDAELRRRLWWHIWTADTRSSEDHGIAVDALDPSTDVKFPLNIDDSALDPELDHVKPPQKLQWTKMTMSLMIYAVSHGIREFHKMLSEVPSGDMAIGSRLDNMESRRRDMVRGATTRVEELAATANYVVPVQRATAMMARIVVRKFDFATQLQLLNLNVRADTSRHRVGMATDERLLEACEILEMIRHLLEDDFIRNWHWSGEMYPQYHVILYVLWHLCVKPTGPSIDRAWDVIDSAFEMEKSRRRRQGMAASSSMWAVFNALRRKALRLRKARSEITATDRTVPSAEKSTASDPGVSTESPSVPDRNAFYPEAIEDQMVWDSTFVDWDSLAQNLGVSSDIGS